MKAALYSDVLATCSSLKHSSLACIHAEGEEGTGEEEEEEEEDNEEKEELDEEEEEEEAEEEEDDNE